ncbi:MAG: NADPH-dependent F420 reductase [Candidatus Acidiferrum sp.]
MNFGILGTGMVGTTLGTKLVSLGHAVKLGSREAENDAAAKWVKQAGKGASQGTFAEAAVFGEMVLVCLRGDVSLPVVKSVGPVRLKGKIVIDVSNPLDVSKGFPCPLLPELVNTNSLGEEVQKALPESFVVKALNTVNCEVMVNPGLVKGESDLFISGNDAGAKSKVVELLRSFGWKNFIDLGDIATARGTEMLMPIWMRMMVMFGTPHFNYRIVR